MNKPWISPGIKNELWKQINLGKAAKRSKKSEDVISFSKQKSKVSLLLEDAKLTWLAENPDQEQHWLTVLANEEREKCYWCDVCEKGFGDQSELEEHEQAHQTCGIDGCTYFAHAEVLDKHIMHQHLTGLYNRIAQGTSPEEIQKWREERKKNFPTKAKVQEKVAKEKEMRERGEVMGLGRKKRTREEIVSENAAIGDKDNEESQCNCRARQMMGRGRGGRGRGRGGGGRLPRNVRHQGHCQELQNIRSRAQETRERKQKSYEERMAKRKKRGVAEKKEEVEEESSEEEEPGWNGGLWKFKGTKEVNDTMVSSVETEKNEEMIGISDDEFEKDSSAVKPLKSVEEQVDMDCMKANNTESLIKSNTFLKNSAEGHISATASSEEDMEVLETMEQVKTRVISTENDFEFAVTDQLLNSQSFKTFIDDFNKRKFDVNVNIGEHQENSGQSKQKIESSEKIPLTRVSNDANISSDDEPPEEISIVKGAIKGEESAQIQMDFDDEPPEEMAITKVPINSQENDRVKPGTKNATYKTESEDIKQETPAGSAKSEHSQTGINVKPPKAGTDYKSKKATWKNPVPRKSTSTLDRRMRPQTLLERLLKDEIVSERNKILQCVRFVCRNNFFGVGQALPEQGPAFPEKGTVLSSDQGAVPQEKEPESNEGLLSTEWGSSEQEPAPPGEETQI